MGMFFSEEASALREQGYKNARDGVWCSSRELEMNQFYQQGVAEAEAEKRRKQEEEERNRNSGW